MKRVSAAAASISAGNVSSGLASINDFMSNKATFSMFSGSAGGVAAFGSILLSSARAVQTAAAMGAEVSSVAEAITGQIAAVCDFISTEGALSESVGTSLNAMKMVHESWAVSEGDFAVLRDHGLDDEDIWDIAGITALFGLSNRMANFLSMRPNDEFYAMAR